MIDKIKKRNGTIVKFERLKIENAIRKALKSVGKEEISAKELSDKVVNKLHETFGEFYIPTVEEIQDIVEKVLIESGLSDVAKSYILYRQKRAEIREEKKVILNKKFLDEVDKKFSVNALKVLASRYLQKDENGKIIESPKSLFERVAVNFALAEILFDERVYDKNGEQKIEKNNVENFKKQLDQWDNVLKIGKYKLNKWHLNRLIHAYERLASQGKMKKSFGEIVEMIVDGKFDKYEKLIEEFYNLMVNQDFMPNTPALINSGRKLGMLSACFVLDVEDDLRSIMKMVSDVAVIHKAGGGTGMNFSKIRPKGDLVGSTMGAASGPISFMRIVDTTTDVIKQGGVRRGANMGIMEIWHPDIEDFIRLKQEDGVFENFNISVGLWEDFWDALQKKKEYPLKNPRNGKIMKYIDPESIFHLISYSAWLRADPGVLFFDNINKRNVLIEAKNGPIRTTNPCGEEPLYPYESCNLASVNIANFVKDVNGKKEFDWERFMYVARRVARSLDNAIEVNRFPIPEIEENTLLTRRIGAGIMGLADALFKLGIRYNSHEGYEFMKKVAEALTFAAYTESIQLAKERGSFPLFDKTKYPKGDLPIEGFYRRTEWNFDWNKIIEDIKKHGLRNAMVTTNAPTGSISMIADTSNGIEPIFSLVFEKNVTVGSFFYVDPIFKKELEKRGLFNDNLMKAIADNYGSVQGIDEIPKELQDVFVTSMDVHWIDHLIAQSVLQLWITDSISKTINMPSDVTVEDVKKAYLLAHEIGCKGVTVYRDGSKMNQVLNVNSEKKKLRKEPEISEYAKKILAKVFKENPFISEMFGQKGSMILVQDLKKFTEKKQEHDKCPVCGGKVVFEAGCERCIECGWSACTVS